MNTQTFRGPLAIAGTLLVTAYLLHSSASGQLVAGANRVIGDPRIPIHSIPFTCDRAGSYFATAHLDSPSSGLPGIHVTADDVSIDLNGFTLDGISGTGGDGIKADVGLVDLRISNGTVREWGSRGMSLDSVHRVQVTGVHVIGNLGGGIRTGDEAIVRNCQSSANGGAGLELGARSRVADSLASFNGDEGFAVGDYAVASGLVATENGKNGVSLGAGSSASNCTASINGFSGFEGGEGTVFESCVSVQNVYDGFRNAYTVTEGAIHYRGCSAEGNYGNGFAAGNSATLLDCLSKDNDVSGASVLSRSQVERCSFMQNGHAGLSIVGDEGHILNNTASLNVAGGLVIYGDYNLVARNRASLNGGGNFIDNGTSNRLATVNSQITAAGPWDNVAY
jgi:hypothetical protein